MAERDIVRLVLDTNVFVAAGFRRSSASAELVDRVRRGEAVLVWNEATRAEARTVLRRIPPVSWNAVRDLFAAAGRFDGDTPGDFTVVPDPSDRKFAALAAAAGAVLVSADDDLLGQRDVLDLTVLAPGEALRRIDPK